MMMAGSSNKPGKVIVISGPSGVGKTTICRRLCEMIPASFSVSVTTREPRAGEAEACDYQYISREEFERLRDSNGLVEWAEVYGNMYGTPMAPIAEAVGSGRSIILEIDIQGCTQVRRKMPEALTFFILPPTAEEQRRRIEGRATDAAEVIKRRLQKADGEIRHAKDADCYDEFLINDDLEETVELMHRSIVGDG